MTNDLNKYTSFKHWMLDTYELPDWENIEHSGCINGVSGLIYYSETNDLYDAFAHELHDVLAEYKDMTGEFPASVIDKLGDASSFKNEVVWFVAEWYASDYMTDARTRDECEV